MKVLIEFESVPGGASYDAVWIIDTPENRAWFERQVGRIDANSAVFKDGSDPLAIIWNVFEHHPNWAEILVRGAALTPAIEGAVRPDASASSEGPAEFRLTRP